MSIALTFTSDDVECRVHGDTTIVETGGIHGHDLVTRRSRDVCDEGVVAVGKGDGQGSATHRAAMTPPVAQVLLVARRCQVVMSQSR